MSIIYNWEHYFTDNNEGLGTTYERFILHRYFEFIKTAYAVKSVLEIPSFGMTGISGINSMWWAQQGARVTIVDDNEKRVGMIKPVWEHIGVDADFVLHNRGYSSLPFQTGSFDMSWNFASLWFVRELEEFLRELARVTRKVIFISIPNNHNILSMAVSDTRRHVDVFPQNIVPSTLKKIMEKTGWSCRDQGFFDVPPWPDIAMKKEDLLRKIGFKHLAEKLEGNPGSSICILDYYGGKDKQMAKNILRYAYLEDLPNPLKQFWAHHRYLIFAPR